MKQPEILPASQMCLCRPDFVMLYKVRREDRWVVGRQIFGTLTTVIEKITDEDAMEYLAGDYSHWMLVCAHCGLTYSEGKTTA